MRHIKIANDTDLRQTSFFLISDIVKKRVLLGTCAYDRRKKPVKVKGVTGEISAHKGNKDVTHLILKIEKR